MHQNCQISALCSLSLCLSLSFYDVPPPFHSVCCLYNGSYFGELNLKLLKGKPVFSVHMLCANGVQQREKTEKEGNDDFLHGLQSSCCQVVSESVSKVAI